MGGGGKFRPGQKGNELRGSRLDEPYIVKAAALRGCRTPNRLRRRIYTELCCQRFHLLSGFFEGAGAIDFFCFVAEFVLNRELRGDAGAGVVIAEAASAKSLELLFGAAPSDHEAVQVLEVASFDWQRGFYERSVLGAVARPFGELPDDGCLHAWVKDGVEAGQLRGIGENDGGELGAMDALI